MNIKFEDTYEKMPFQAEKPVSATLLQVFRLHKRDMSPAFIEYDTRKKNGKQYFLQDQEYLVLLLKANIPNVSFVFTTCRSWNEEKEDYYKSMVGKTFGLKIERRV